MIVIITCKRKCLPLGYREYHGINHVFCLVSVHGKRSEGVLGKRLTG